MRTYRAAALALFGVLLFASLFVSVPAAAQGSRRRHHAVR